MGFEPTISAGERPQTYALDRAALGLASEGFGDFKIGGHVIRTVKFTDGLVLLAKGEEVLQGMIERQNEIGIYYGRKVYVVIT